MRLRFTPSIANAIFALAAILIALMAIVAAINTTLSLQVAKAIGSINDTALPAYSRLARTHIRTLEQSLALRQAAISVLDGRADMVDAYLKEEARASGDVEAELTAAQTAVADRTGEDAAASDRILLGRLQVQIEQAQHARTLYAPARERLLAALQSRKGDDIQLALDQLDAVRTEQNERFEGARREALTFATRAVDTTQESGRNVIQLTIVMLGLAILLGVLMAVWIARRMVSALRRLVQATEAVESGRYDADIPVTSDDEIGRLTRSFNLMLAELRLKEKIRETFGRYLDPKVVASLLDKPQQVGAGGERRRMTILFVDMAGFTRLSEEVSPPVLVGVLNRFLTLLGEAVHEQNGIVDKYLGDGMMAFWGPPFVPDEDQAALACAAALRQVEKFEQFLLELPDLLGIRSFRPKVAVRIGVATGGVIAGSIGSAQSMNFTVMGDPVNVASRLEGLNKVYGTSVLVSDATAGLAGSAARFREVDRVAVVGRDEPVTICEPFPVTDPADPAQDALLAAYARGLGAYRRRDWDGAAAGFAEALALRSADGPALAMLARVERFRVNPPPPSWDGTWVADGK